MRRMLVLILLLAAGTPMPTLAFKCSDGQESHVATAEEAASAGKGKDGSTNAIIAGTTQVCPGDARAGISGDAGAAKQYLLSIARNLRNSAAPPDEAHIRPLNDTFAICAARYFKEYAQRYGSVAVVSAYRDGPSGENARAGGAANSNHTKGLAIDANPNGSGSSYETMWSFARQNPQFGICFPYLSGDRPHMTLAGSGTGEAAKCATQGVTKPCDGTTFDPNSVRMAQQTPSSGVSQYLRDYLGGRQQPFMGGGGSSGGAGATGGYGPVGAMPYTSQQPYSGGTQPYTPAQPYAAEAPRTGSTPASSAVPASGGTPSSNQVLASGATPASSAAPDQSRDPVSNALVANGSKPGVNAPFDLISALADPARSAKTATGRTSVIAVTSATGSLIALNADIRGQIVGQSADTERPADTSLAEGSVPGYRLDAASGIQTFASADDGDAPSAEAYAPGSTWQILETMKQILLSILRILRPFGSVGNPSFDEHLE